MRSLGGMPFVLDTPGHVALRRGRRSLPEQAYFVTFTAQARRKLFLPWDAAAKMSALLAHPSQWSGGELLAWVLMPDHWHGLVVLRADDLSGVLGRAKGASAFHFNRTMNRTGRVWARGFHDRAIRGAGNLRAAARYLVANPLRAQLVQSIGDYPFWDACWLCDDAPL